MAEANVTILLVDGDRERRGVRGRALTQAGYRVLQAGDARRAQAVLRQECPQLAIARLALEPYDGAELLRRARAHALTAHVPFMLLQSTQEALPAGLPVFPAIERVLVEPVSPETLVAQAVEALQSLPRALAQPKSRLDLLRLEVHDLKAPLGNIINLSELMLGEEVERAQQVEFLSSIAANAQTMLKLVLNLLNVAALESGRLPLRREPVALQTLVQSAIQQIAWLIRRQGVQVANRVPPDLPPLPADSELLGRLIVNLLDNALQHSRSGDEIAVEAGRDGDDVRIDVLDRGPGVPADYRERIFDEFFRMGSGGGISRSTGLGLTFCRLVAEAHGGRIWVEPREGGGSRFSVRLLLRPQAEPERT